MEEVEVMKWPAKMDFFALTITFQGFIVIEKMKSLVGKRLKKIEGILPEGIIYGDKTDYDSDGWKWPGDRNVASCRKIVDALEQGQDPPGSGENAAKVLEIAIGLRESHRRGSVPVDLPLHDRNLRIIPKRNSYVQ